MEVDGGAGGLGGYAEPPLNAPTSPTIAWWRWPTILSLDAPLVTLAWESLFAREAEARLAWHHYVIIGATVWLAYAADRWLESWRVPADRLVTPRHQFYYRHAGATAIVWLLVLAGAVGLSLLRLTLREWGAGLVLAVPAIAYVLSHQLVHRHHPWRVPKEVCVAALLTAGAGLFPAVDARTGWGGLLEAAGWFFALAFTNCALISAWERQVDREHGQESIVRSHPRWLPAVRGLPWLWLGAAGVLLLATPAGSATAARECAALSAGLLGLVDRLQPRLGWAASRVLADAVLLTPAAWLVAQWIRP